MTDAAVLAGLIDPKSPLAGNLFLDPTRARGAMSYVAARCGLTVERCAEGALEIATSTMARALRKVSVERGTDPREMALVSFGGAGPLFACRLADALGMSRAIVPAHAGVLSAVGLAHAPERVELLRSLHRSVAGLSDADVEKPFAGLTNALLDELPNAAVDRYVDGRYAGQGYELTVLFHQGVAGWTEAFHRAHLSRFGHADREATVEAINLRVVGTRAAKSPPQQRGVTRSAAGVGWEPGREFVGPLTLPAFDTTVRIEKGWVARVHETGALIIERT